jgi:hypothetical protein
MSFLDKFRSQENNRPEKGDLVLIQGDIKTLYLVSDVVADDTVCRVTSLNEADSRVIPFWQIKQNYSLSCR